MTLSGLHILLTYKCTLECDHCFAFGSPRQEGVLSFRRIETLLEQAIDLGTIESVYFEGGEPFLYYNTLVRAVERASRLGFDVGIVSNGYWAVDVGDAVAWLEPFAGRLKDLSLSCDDYHGRENHEALVANAQIAADYWQIPNSLIAVAQPEDSSAATARGTIPSGESRVIYRGRAAEALADRAGYRPSEEFTSCSCENLRDPGRVHVDPFGEVQICQGISIGNVFETSLPVLVREYEPDLDPIVGPLLRGGPASLARNYGVEHEQEYADACHFCFETRKVLRSEFPDVLKPDEVYGESPGKAE